MYRLIRGPRVLALAALSCLALPAAAQTAGEPVVAANGNELFCALRNTGDICDAGVSFGGYWPEETIDQYVFGAGVMVAGIVAEDAGFEWAGDTVPAYFADFRGTQQHGTPITNIFSSAQTHDLRAWPRAGDIADFGFAGAYPIDEVFHPIHARSPAISDLDTWVLYWDGDPDLSANRDHPLGIAVEQRTLQWNAPEGLQSAIIVVQRLTNVTDLPVFRDTIIARFFDGDSSAVPAGGWRLDSVFVGIALDADVTGDATNNYSLLMPGMDAVVSYHQGFTADDFDYPGDIFYPPFLGNSPGLVATALLHADTEDGSPMRTRMTSVVQNQGSCTGLCDPIGAELWRHLSGHFGNLVDRCNVADPLETRACFQAAEAGDMRTYQSVGPYSLEPGESVTIAFAMVAAPTLDVPGLVIGGDNSPEEPTLAPGCHGDAIGMIAAAAGWLSTPSCPAPGEPLDPDAIETLPGSLLHRIQVARAFAAEGFVSAFAPEAPAFSLAAGSGRIAVAWLPSPTEENGDPFHGIASDTASALFNPSYRMLDVEGYRIYRSTDGVNFELVAQFDSDTTTFADHLCETDPEWAAGDACAGDPRLVSINDQQGWRLAPLPLTMYRPGDRRRLGPAQVAILGGDTVNTSPDDLDDQGIPYAWIDTDVRDGFRYHYRVTAFDVNSARSGEPMLESGSAVRSAIPRPSLVGAGTVRIELRGADGTPLDSAAVATLDPVSGTFDGPQPPTDAFGIDTNVFAPHLLAGSVYEVVLDSVTPDYYGGEYHFSLPSGETVTVSSPDPSLTAPQPFTFAQLMLPSTSAGESDSLPGFAAVADLRIRLGYPQWHSGDADWAPLVPPFWPFSGRLPADATDGGSRWFAGAAETDNDPTLGTAHGELPGITIFQPTSHNFQLGSYVNPVNGTEAGGDLFRRFYQTTWALRRAADIQLRWESDGVAEVFDVTHRVPVPFREEIRASYGFLDDADGDGVLTFGDFYHVPGLGSAATVGNISASFPVPLLSQPRVMQVDVDGDLMTDGTGFGLYIAGVPYLFQGPRPTGGTWTLRTYNGAVVDGPDGYTMQTRRDGVRTPGVPGLRIAVVAEAPAVVVASAYDVSDVHTVPDPFYVQSAYASAESRSLRFTNLPPEATIRIYSLSGVLVDVLHHRDESGGGLATWDLRTRDGSTIASGVYLFHVTGPGGQEHVGRFTVVTSRMAQ